MALFLRLLLTLVGVMVILYLAISVFLFLQQARFIFFPLPLIETTPSAFGLPYEEVWLTVPNGKQPERIHGWWIPAVGTGTLLYLHGNGVNIGANVAQAARFHRLGLSVLLIDYRGYGQSEGAFPSEAQVYQDAQTAWNYLTQDRTILPQQILIYGHSLGGAIAVQLAIQNPDAAGLIVQSSFTSIREMIDRTTPFGVFPVDWILTQRFASIQKISFLQMPLLVIHGMADEQIPFEMSKGLYNAAPDPKQLYLVPDAGHNDVAEIAGDSYLQVVQRFAQQAIASRSSAS